MKLSIVTTLYKSSPYIDEFYARISKEAQKITDDYEIIFVDDGSPDDSLQKAVALYEKDSKVKVIELSRNFGHHKAIMTGLSHAKGEFVFLIDSDLEEEPELLGKFWEELHKEKELDVVYGVQESRKGGWFERWSGTIFYSIFIYLSGMKITRNQIMTRLMSKKYVYNLVAHQDRAIFLGGLFELTGFHQKSIVCNKAHKGDTSYTFTKRLGQALNSIISFSAKPLYMISLLGMSMFLLAIIYIVYLIIGKLFFFNPISGWTSILVSIYFLGGLILFSIGVIGIYINKIFEEVKDRPYSIIKNVFEKGLN
ncbi:glycosyltransferase family 2 protein [Aliarcobacter cryaerophilus]|uniref:glycosyltransferase family 2 protein n=1 Tax=Aliarcobacter cryaerophilus TaxID=28198 RepID=UPI003DA5798F